MIYWDKKNLSLLATGLPLKTIAEISLKHTSDIEVLEMLKAINLKYSKRFEIMNTYNTLVQQGIQKLPIIPVLTGIPGIGKTALAKELSIALNINLIIGGDVLRSSIRSVLPKKGNESFFTSIYESWSFFGKCVKENIIKGYKAQCKIMNNVVQAAIVDRGFRDGESMIFEYIHFLPSQFKTEILNHPSFIPIILKITDKEVHLQRINSREYYSHLRSSGERLISEIDKYLQMQEYQTEEADKFNLKTININNFEQGFDLILDYIFERIEILNNLKNYNPK